MSLANCLEIGASRADIADAAGKSRHPATEHDAFQAELARQGLACIVEALSDPERSVGGIDRHVHAIEPITGRVMPRGKAVAGDLAPNVRLQGVPLGDDEGRAVADDPAIVDGDELALREVVDLAAHHRRGQSGLGMIDAPAEIDPAQLEELHLSLRPS